MLEKYEEIIRCMVLGIVQGLTEFLPISSSFHLRLVPDIFGWPAIGLGLSAFLHLGTLIAVFIYFGKDLFEIAIETFKSLSSPKSFFASLGFKIIIASLPAIIFGFFAHDFFEKIDQNLTITTICLIVVGILLFITDLKPVTINDLEKNINWWQALLIGFGQAAALFSGVSRSGSTITVARLLGFSRPESARFSFLMGSPVILGAGLYEVFKAFKNTKSLEVSWTAAIIGAVFSAIIGYFAIKFLLKFLQTQSLFPFMLYRLIVGSIVLFAISKGFFK